jgi:hypothetical protein
LLGPAPARAQDLSVEVLWHALVEKLERPGPGPARIVHLAAPGTRYVLVAALLSSREVSADPPTVRIESQHIRLEAQGESFPQIGVFDDVGAVLWHAPPVQVFPGATTTLHAVFAVPETLTGYRLHVGAEATAELPAARPLPPMDSRIGLEIEQIRWLADGIPAEAEGGDAPGAMLQPWPGHRLMAIDLKVQQPAGAAEVPFRFTTDDVYVRTSTALYRCAGVLRRGGTTARTSPLSVLVSATDGTGRGVARLTLLYSLGQRDMPAWLCLGELCARLDTPEPAPTAVNGGSGPR